MGIRTHNCGELSKSDVDQSVSLAGWINSVRTHGQIIFVDLRDRYGKTQLVLNSENHLKIGKTLSMEDVISIEGLVSPREKNLVNPDLSTGEIEVIVSDIKVLSDANPLPLSINDREASTEEHRLKLSLIHI